jgi:hypothetical protein
LLPLVLADVMRGTGRYNVSRGVIGTIQGIGGSLSNGVAGLIVVTAGYDTAFLILAALAAMALLLVWVAMPETRGPDQENAAGRVVAASRRSPGKAAEPASVAVESRFPDGLQGSGIPDSRDEDRS